MAAQPSPVAVTGRRLHGPAQMFAAEDWGLDARVQLLFRLDKTDPSGSTAQALAAVSAVLGAHAGDAVLLNAVRGISDLITVHGLINLDFADVRTVMNEAGVALMGTGSASGENRAVEAAQEAISSPLLEDLSIEGARGVLINITGGDDVTLFEVNEASVLVQEAAHEDANIIFGAVIDETIDDGAMRVTVIATGLDDGRMRVGDDRREPEWTQHHNVTPLRPEPATADAPSAPAAEQSEPAPAAQEQRVFDDLAVETDQQASSEEFLSPFEEDELDVPTFLRRGGEAEGEEEDKDEPAFLRRQMD